MSEGSEHTVQNPQTFGVTPIRGTQSFVGMMAEVWKRPSLTAIEVLTRWIAWLPLLFVGLPILLGAFGMDVRSTSPAVDAVFAREQTQVTVILHGGYLFALNAPRYTGVVLLLLALAALWGCLSAFGRTILLRRMQPALTPRRLTLCLLASLRVALFTAILAFWLSALVLSWIHFVQIPQSRSQYPDYVPGFALMLVLTLGLFLLWATTSWLLRLAPIFAMSQRLGPWTALAAAWRTGPLRSKLIEINLVLGIVKVALLVLAMALSACPLPFANNQTQRFLIDWTLGVAFVWMLASDYFHVVRQASYLRLAQAYNFLPGVTAPRAVTAS